MNDDPIFAVRAIEIGVKGYVSKTGDPHDLVEAIREVGKGGTHLPSAIARSIAFAGPAFACRS
jgi:two-component system invasion response regulator UvrY